jgi:hypothetical protein
VKTVALSVGLWAVPALAQTFNVVSPNSRTLVEGNAGETIPFAAPTVTRYQQVFGAGSLANMVGKHVTGIAFRLDSSQATDYAGGFLYTSLNIRMSTTTMPVAGLSAVMDNNVGADVATVFDGAYTLPTLHATTSPRPFDMEITFQQSFLYNGGNLLIDIAGPIGPATGGFELDAEDTPGDAVARCYAVQGNPVVVDSRGLITRFTADVVSSCYANCDGSTTAPVLNVLDFLCFQWQFFAGTAYANCDGSTTPPVLNVNDFICFQQHFAQGCP